MSKDKLPRIYADANFFIPFLKGGEIVDGIDRAPICLEIINDAKEGTIELLTSWGTMIECVTPPTGEASSIIGIDSVEELFDYEFILKCDVDRFTAEDARNIQVKASKNAEYQAKLKNTSGKKIKKMRPFDALHIATAVLQEVDYLFTYDKDHIIPLSGHEIVGGLKICTPFRPWECSKEAPKTGLFAETGDKNDSN